MWHRHPPWARAAIVILVLIGALELWHLVFAQITTAGIILTFFVTYSGYQWGRTAGLTAATISVVYLFWSFYTRPGALFDITDAEANRLITYMLFMPAFAIMAARRREMHLASERLAVEKAWRGDLRTLMSSRLRKLADDLEALRTHSQTESRQTSDIAGELRRMADMTDPSKSKVSPESLMDSGLTS